MISSEHIKRLFDKFIDLIFATILMFIIFGILIGTLQLFNSLWVLLKFTGITGEYINFITDILTLYVLVELSRSLVDYFKSHKLRLTSIVDAAIVFILREILIGLFKHSIETDVLYALATLIFVLGLLRFGSIFMYQREKQLESESS